MGISVLVNFDLIYYKIKILNFLKVLDNNRNFNDINKNTKYFRMGRWYTIKINLRYIENLYKSFQKCTLIRMYTL